MPVEQKHPCYGENEAKWRKCRCVIKGEEAVKAAGVEFLPELSGQSDTEYNAYKTRAVFFAGTGRTLEAMLGMVFKEPPKVEVPETQKEYLDHITRDRKSFEIFTKDVAEEVFTTARYGVLADMDEAGIAPYLVGYCAESIWNWRTRTVDGRERLDLVVLEESFVEPEDEFDTTPKKRLRVLKLDSESGNYTIDLYIKTDHKDPITKSEWVRIETKVPLVRGIALTEIPFVIISTKNLSPDVEKPPLLDIANLNLSHYRSSADLEHGRHFTALPTPWAAGFDTKGTLKIGSGTAWIAEDPQASCGYLEFTGQGLTALENALKEKQSQMAVLGARLLETEKNAAEAADTLRIRRASETNIVASVADTVGEGMEVALTWIMQWLGADPKAEVDLNKEYLDTEITPEMFAKLMEAVQGGLMSWDTFFYNMKRSSMYPDSRTLEDEKGMIELTGGLGGMGTPPEPKKPDTPPEPKDPNNPNPEE